MDIAIFGKTGSGKSYLASALAERGFYKVPSFTTRPPREGEKDGVDYYFVNDGTFRDLRADGDIVDESDFVVASGAVWYYGTSREAWYGAAGRNRVITLDPIRFMPMFGNTRSIWMSDPRFAQTVRVYLDIPDTVRIQRLHKRGDDQAEIERRIIRERSNTGDGMKYYYDRALAFADAIFKSEKAVNSYIQGMEVQYGRTNV